MDSKTFEDNFTEFAYDFGLEEVKDGESVTEFISSAKMETDKKDLLKYFTELGNEVTIDDLVEFYRIDLEMFGYSVEEYYNIIKNMVEDCLSKMC